MKDYKLYYKNFLGIFLMLLLTTTLWAETNNEREKLLKKLKKYPYLLAYVDDKYKKDKELVLEVLKKNGRTLQYASVHLQDNEVLVLEAVHSNGGALAYASKRLQDKEEIVSIAIDSYGEYLKYASKRLRDDDDIVMDALRSNGANLQYASKRLRDDRWYVHLAIQNNSSALEYASKRLKNDKALVLSSVGTYSSNLSYASELLQDDKELVLEAIKSDVRALRYASKRLKKDKEILAFLLKNNPNNLIKRETKNIEIEFNEKVEDLASVPLGIKSSLALKSIKILHESDKNKIFLGQFNLIKGQPIDYYVALNLTGIASDKNTSILIVLEELKGKKHIIKKSYLKSKGSHDFCNNFKNTDDALNTFTEQKYKRHIMKLRIKDELAYGAFMVMHPMLGEEDAKVLNMKTDYIQHVVAKLGNKIVFDFQSSARLRVDPFFRFTFNAPKISGKLKIIVTDNSSKKKIFLKVYEL